MSVLVVVVVPAAVIVVQSLVFKLVTLHGFIAL